MENFREKMVLVTDSTRHIGGAIEISCADSLSLVTKMGRLKDS